MEERYSFIYKLIFYVTGFLLFCEWLLPLETISETNDVKIFFVYAAFCFFISFIQVPWFLSVPLKGLGLAFIIDGLYIAERIFSSDWFTVIYEQILFNVQIIRMQEWWQMTPMFRSLLFLILLWLMSYLLYYWFVIARRMFFFVLLAILYVTIVDTFTPYDGKWSMIRTFIFGMVALGLSSFAREMEREAISLAGVKKAKVWALPMIAVILFSSAAAYASPKLGPQWPDPVPYIESAASGAGPGQAIQKVGYGEDDSRLGGSFIQDDSPVFQAIADGKRYWRIESKNLYTGKGWEDTLEDPVIHANVNNIPFETFTEQVRVEEQTAVIEMSRNASFRKLVYPYGVNSLEDYPEDYGLLVHQQTGEMETVESREEARVDRYVVQYNYPSFEYSQLREAEGEDPEDIRKKYLQLPDSLPNRVRHLASEIVEGETNRYDRAKAVESYFSLNGYQYSTTDVPVPGENQDYVDQFLFESKIGYCDNFSTSMVVLLRAEGIPARWVKGFTGGERIGSDGEEEDIQNVYQVTSANAHSWVEVYFPDVGWVPFEPTQGFTNNADFYTDVETDDTENPAAAQGETETPEQNPLNQQRIQEQQENQNSAAAGGTEQGDFTWIWITLCLLLAAGISLYVTRFRWISAVLIRKYRRNYGEQTYEKAFHYLLKVLEHKGFKRMPEQTLREYAQTIDRHYQSNEMRRLTNDYERILYRNESQQQHWPQVTELWENLIKKTLS